jgi:colanic acid biosynthesis glycosyl transferase WcaI
MRILIHGLNFSPEKIGIGKYTGEMASWLAQAGHEVRVVTAPPYYPDWKVQPPYRAWKFQRETWQGVEVFRCPLWVPAKPSGIKRILHLLTFAVSSSLEMSRQVKWKPDIIFCVAPTIFCARASLGTARKSKAISWLHIQDFELDAATNLGMVKSGNVITRFAAHWERTTLERFDRVSSISKNMVAHLVEKGVSAKNAVLFPNWVDTEVIHPRQEPQNPYREQLGVKNNQILILYSGNMGVKQGLGLVVDAANQLQENDQFVFVLCGDGAARKDLELSAEGLPNLKFLNLQPPENLNLLLNAADMHILPQQAGAADLVMPSKLLGMLASGKPVIATANQDTELAEVVNQTGIVVPPGDVEGIVQAVFTLSGSINSRKKLGEKGRELVCERWGMDNVMKKALHGFQRVKM